MAGGMMPFEIRAHLFGDVPNVSTLAAVPVAAELFFLKCAISEREIQVASSSRQLQARALRSKWVLTCSASYHIFTQQELFQLRQNIFFRICGSTTGDAGCEP